MWLRGQHTEDIALFGRLRVELRPARDTLAATTMGAGRIALSSFAMFALHGCSYLFVTPVPENHRRGDAVECTTSRAAPIVDTVMATSHLASLLYLETRSYPAQNRQQVDLLAASGFAGLLIYSASAVHGYLATADCAEAVASSVREPGLILRTTRRDPPAAPDQRASAAPPVGSQEAIPAATTINP